MDSAEIIRMHKVKDLIIPSDLTSLSVSLSYIFAAIPIPLSLAHTLNRYNLQGHVVVEV